MPELTEGAIRPGRFLLVTAPATAMCLGVGVGIVLGWISVALATAQPLDFETSEGHADSLSLRPGTDVGLTGLPVGATHAAAIVRVRGTELADMCLLPRIELPLVGGLGSLRITTSDQVDLGDVSLAASGGGLDDVTLPTTVIGAAPGEGEAPGGFSVTSGGGDGVHLGRSELRAHGLRLDGGISLRSLGLRPGLGRQSC